MPTLQELVDIATRYDTLMAHEMVLACVRAYTRICHELGERACEVAPLVISPHAVAHASHRRPPDPYEIEENEWRRWVERNSDTRWNHV